MEERSEQLGRRFGDALCMAWGYFLGRWTLGEGGGRAALFGLLFFFVVCLYHLIVYAVATLWRDYNENRAL